MKIDEHPLWNTMNNLNFIKVYLKENLIEELPDSFWELLDESISDVEGLVSPQSDVNGSSDKEIPTPPTPPPSRYLKEGDEPPKPKNCR